MGKQSKRPEIERKEQSSELILTEARDALDKAAAAVGTDTRRRESTQHCAVRRMYLATSDHVHLKDYLTLHGMRSHTHQRPSRDRSITACQ